MLPMLLPMVGREHAVIDLGDLVMILDLHRQGLCVSAIARESGVDRKTVRKYIERGLEAPSYSPRQPRQTVIDPFTGYLRERVTAYPGLTGRRLFREVKELGYCGGYTVVTDFLRDIRPATTKGFEVRFETPPGEQAQVDFARFHVVFTDEPQTPCIVWLFSLVLGFSRQIWARFVVHQDLATVLRCHVAAFEALGGSPTRPFRRKPSSSDRTSLRPHPSCGRSRQPQSPRRLVSAQTRSALLKIVSSAFLSTPRLKGLCPKIRIRSGPVRRVRVREIPTELIVVLVVEAFDRRVLDGSVHSFDLVVGPGMTRFCQTMFDVEIAQAPLKAWQRKSTFSARIALMSSGVQPSPEGSVKCVPLSVSMPPAGLAITHKSDLERDPA